MILVTILWKAVFFKLSYENVIWCIVERHHEKTRKERSETVMTCYDYYRYNETLFINVVVPYLHSFKYYVLLHFRCTTNIASKSEKNR